MKHLTKLGLFAAVFTIGCADGVQPPTSPARANLAKTSNSGIKFLRSATDATKTGTTLVVDFKITGMGAGTAVTVTVTGTVTVVEECINGGGTNPHAANKESNTSSFSESGSFSADAGGNVIGSLSVNAARVLVCPPGQTSTLISATYSNVQISTPSPTAGGDPISFSFTGSF